MKRLNPAVFLLAFALPLHASVDFHKDIAPILQTSCVECHNAEKSKGDLRLDTAADFSKGGDSGAVVVPGKPEDSILVYRLESTKPSIMMPNIAKNTVPNSAVSLIRQWIREMK